MKARIAILLAFAFLAVGAHSQTDDLIHVKGFQGSTVGAKVASAMVSCPAYGTNPCILVIDASLAGFPAGTIPTMCSNCTLWDFRYGAPTSSAAQNAVLITAPPYNAACDGTTDDTAAIQAAFNSGASVVYFPQSTAAETYQCDVSSTIAMPALSGTAPFYVELQGSILADTTTGSSPVIDASAPAFATVDGGTIQFENNGSGAGIYDSSANTLNIDNMVIQNGANGYDSIQRSTLQSVATYILNSSSDGVVYVNGFLYVNGWSDVNGTSVQSQDFKMDGQVGTYVNVTLLADGTCEFCVDPGDYAAYLGFQGLQSFGNGGMVVFSIGAGANAFLNGNVQWQNDETLFSGTWGGTLAAYEGNENVLTTYTNGITVPGCASGSYVKADGTGCGAPAGYTQAEQVIVSSGICTTANTAYSNCSFTVTWPQAFADTNYAVSLTPGAASNCCLTDAWISSKTKTGVTVSLQNGDASAAYPLTLYEVDLIGLHP